MQQSSITQQAVTQQPAQSTNHPNINPTDPTPVFVGLLIALPIAIALGIVSFRQYQINARRKRIEKLERLWNLNLERK